jgi:transposase
LGHEHLALPRRRGDREALRVLLGCRGDAVSAGVAAINKPQGADRQRARRLARRTPRQATTTQITRCAGLRDRPARSLEHRTTIRVLRITAQPIQQLHAEIHELGSQLTTLVDATAPWRVDLPGVGPVTAAQVLVSWSYAGRLRSEAAFAALAGTSPIPASSGQVTATGPDRSGDRQLNRALHTIVLVRLPDDPTPVRTPPGAPLKARLPVRSGGASSASPPGSSSNSSNATTSPASRSYELLDKT